MLTYHREAWTALGDPTRQDIFERLLTRPRAVVELAGELPVSRPAISQHLKILREAGLVVAEPRGTRRIYRPDPRGIAALRSDLELFWTQALEGFKTIVEQSDPKGSA